jgi:DEAD/DEAH box helicase domain-containing protein
MALNGYALETTVRTALAQADFEVLARAQVPGRAATIAPIPAELHPSVRNHLLTRFDHGLYRHQADAVTAALGSNSICLATSTGSGKSLVFMTAAADLLRKNPGAKVLAIYPARALIQDQMEKWRVHASALGLKTGYIDGGVPSDRRTAILRANDAILITPDVVHAWLMSHLADRSVRAFLKALRLVILDEAHVYEGVFGTNMAFLLRRLEAASAPYQLICSTATLGKPENFMEMLLGRRTRTFGPDHDASFAPPKTVLLTQHQRRKDFDGLVQLIGILSRLKESRFLVFADSRRTVELLVAAVHRPSRVTDQDIDPGSQNEEGAEAEQTGQPVILPYRSGYETEDRDRIQRALTHGELAGVVSTSALELGLDIGEVDVVVLVDVPPSVKAFWQRLGRAGRRNPGVCIMIDRFDLIPHSHAGLESYLACPLEPNWLYFENRYIQYTNALCAAVEVVEGELSASALTPFNSLPASFRRFLDNELHPTEVVPEDLAPLRQRAQAGPHHEFPLRTGVEQNFVIGGPFDRRLGSAAFSQVLREAYPGAIYYYMARPYRVIGFEYRKGLIRCKSERYLTTRPISNTMVFPQLGQGILTLYRAANGFLAEADLQVSERVLGFTQQRGSAKEEFRYEPSSPYYQRDLTRFFRTTGVCWFFADRKPVSEPTAQKLLEAFCLEFGVQERDIGAGRFHAKGSPMGPGACQGMCVYDGTYGSLRLTQQLADNFLRVLDAAIRRLPGESEQDVQNLRQELEFLRDDCRSLERATSDSAATKDNTNTDGWVTIIAPGQRGMFVDTHSSREVEIVGHLYTPDGLKYELKHPDSPNQPPVKWLVSVKSTIPLGEETKMIQVNLSTGEIRPLE